MVRVGDFSLLHHKQNCCEAHSDSSPVGKRGCFPWDKVDGFETDHSASLSVKVKNGEAILSLSHIPSWCGA
jgi:hypothetical protein